MILLHGRRRDRVDARRHRESLHLADDRRLRVLRDHVPRVDSRIDGEERRQSVRAGHVKQPVAAPLRHRREVGGRDREKVEDVAKRRAVEVSIRLDPAVRQHHGVVDRTGQLASGNGQRMRECVAKRAGDLRRAAQRIGVLNQSAVDAMGLDDRRAGEQRTQVRCRSGLPRVRPQSLQVGREDRIRAKDRLDAHGGRDVGRLRQRREVVTRKEQHAQHAVGAVDERESFFGAQHNGFNTGGKQCGSRGHRVAGSVAHVPLAHQCQRAVREWREVTGTAKRSELPDHWCHAGVQHRRVALDDHRSDAGAAGRQCRKTQQHHRADDFALDLGTAAGRMRPHERALQLRAQIGSDVAGGQRAEPGRDAVHRLAGLR